ncbi:MAG: hypothetical protein ACLP07_13765 [Terracidiphilus sp.]
MAFVDAVTQAHGGTVEASNREAGGASITITLPLAATEIQPQVDLAGAAQAG